MADTKAEKRKCPIEFTLDIIGGKWKLIILWMLFSSEPTRYSEIKRKIVPITHKMLSQQLKELQAAGLIQRKQFNQIPPKVEYSLSEKGITFIPILKMMYEWGKNNII